MTYTYVIAKLFKKLRGSAIKNSTIHKTSKIESGSNISNVIMEKYSFCGYDCEITNTNIGSFCSIANGVIIGGGMHPIEWVSTSPVFYEGRDSITAKFSEHKREKVKLTNIGHDVWIGQNVLIKQGITIGIGAVIGMGSIVTKDVPPYSITVGNPAKVIKKRFEDDLINSLLLSQWWNAPEDRLKLASKFIKNPSQFLNYLNKSTTV